MASKTKKVARKRQISKNPALQSKKVEAKARRRVFYRLPCNDDKCTMKLHIYLSLDDEWFLHKNSCVDHCNHLPIADNAMLKRSKEMTDKDISTVSNFIISILMYKFCTYN